MTEDEMKFCYKCRRVYFTFNFCPYDGSMLFTDETSASRFAMRSHELELEKE